MIAYLYKPCELKWFMKAVTGDCSCFDGMFDDIVEYREEINIKSSLLEKGFLNPGGIDPVQSFIMRQISTSSNRFYSKDSSSIIFECERISVVLKRDEHGRNVKIIPLESNKVNKSDKK